MGWREVDGWYPPQPVSLREDVLAAVGAAQRRLRVDVGEAFDSQDLRAESFCERMAAAPLSECDLGAQRGER